MMMMQNAFVIHCMKDTTTVMGSNANNLQLKAIQRDNILLIQFSLKNKNYKKIKKSA